MAKGRILFTDDSSSSKSSYKPKILFTDEEEQQEPKSQGFVKNALDYEKALGLGLAQGAGDVGASIGNFPGDIYKYFSGSQESPYHIPHPNLKQYYPEGMAGKIGSLLGEGIGGVAVPGGSIAKATKAFNNPLAKALSGMIAGGVSNAAANEDDRLGAGLTGATVGGALPAAGSIANVPWTKGMASKALKQAEQLIGEREVKNIKIPKDIFTESKDFLPKNLPNKKLLEAARNGDYKTLFTLQSDLGKISRELQKSSSGAERLHGKQAHDLRERMLNSMKEHLSKQGHEDISDLMSKGQKKYRQHMKYVNPITKKIPKGASHAAGIGGIYELFKHFI